MTRGTRYAPAAPPGPVARRGGLDEDRLRGSGLVLCPRAELRWRQAAGMRTGLVIPSSAFHYHRTNYPTLRFDHEDVIADMAANRVPTASATVQKSLDWLRNERPKRFLLWLYQYDVHGWPDLDEAYV